MQEGEFVWAAFPTDQAPAHPGLRHVVYVLQVAALQPTGFSAIVAYTTSSGAQFTGQQPAGLHSFSAAEAAALGQGKAFRLDLKRLAHLPVTPAWFPEISQAGRGILRRAPRLLRDRLIEDLERMLATRPELISRMGPLWRAR